MKQHGSEQFYGVIIGFGKAGKTLAADLAQNSKKVAIIEKSDQMYGGTCINVGCIPSKSLVKSAKQSQIKEPISFEEKAELYKNAISEKRTLTAMLRKKNFDKLNNNQNVSIFTGKASFLSAKEVMVELDDESIVLESEHIFINTGSAIEYPEIDDIKNNKNVYTSETIMDLSELPKRLAIIGGGYIGLEFASIYANFGSEVTIFQRGMRFMPNEDEDIANEIMTSMLEKGIHIQFGAKINSINNDDQGAVITFITSSEQKEYHADAVLIATGRKPNIEDLNLSVANVDLTESSAIKVDENLRTSNSNIWAMGDVTGGLKFTYVSLDDYRIVSSQLIDRDTTRSTSDRKNIPYSIFIDPAYARVGLNEMEAKRQNFNVKVAKLAVSAIPKAQVLKETTGLLKAVIDAETDKILGAMLFCVESYEMINVIKLAMDAGLPYTFLRDQIFTHPTMTESLNDLFTI